jgi:hypothetical protein
MSLLIDVGSFFQVKVWAILLDNALEKTQKGSPVA